MVCFIFKERALKSRNFASSKIFVHGRRWPEEGDLGHARHTGLWTNGNGNGNSVAASMPRIPGKTELNFTLRRTGNRSRGCGYHDS